MPTLDDSTRWVTPEREAEYPASNYNFRYQASLHSVGNYQVSSIPFLTSSVAPITGSTPVEVSFPSVTKFITIKNIDSGNHPLKVGFSANGVNGTNYLTLTQNESFSADYKVTSVFLVSGDSTQISASVIAGLTGISVSQLPNNWSGSLGVG